VRYRPHHRALLIREREFHLASRFGTAKLTGSSSPDDQLPVTKVRRVTGFCNMANLGQGNPAAEVAAAKAVYPMTAAVLRKFPKFRVRKGPLNPRVPRESVRHSPMANSK